MENRVCQNEEFERDERQIISCSRLLKNKEEISDNNTGKRIFKKDYFGTFIPQVCKNSESR
jgi:hypothetical protein